MAEPEDMIVVLLREMRRENIEGFSSVNRRLEKLEETSKSFRHALSADSLPSKMLTGEFEERIEALEKKVRELESQK
jgi:polyhydroxyalkanoate synthesis regulator phasin